MLESFLQGGGACAALVAARDWSSTSLGPIEGWPASLTATVANMLHTRQPMLLFWGPDLIQFYNDAFVPSFGQGKHPEAIGQRARECWADAWPVVGAQIEAVMSRGEPAWFEDALVPIERNGRMEEVFWTYSYSPAYDDRGQVNGTLVIVTEMTGRVLAARRLAALAHLSLALSTASSRAEVIETIHQLAQRWPADLPFAVIATAGAVDSCTGIEAPDAAMLASTLAQLPASQVPSELVVSTSVTGTVWPEPITRALVCGIGATADVLVLGLSPRLPLDDAYRSFVAQVGEHVASAIKRIRILLALQEASRAKDEFLAMLGHELRNPLAPIVAALEIMKLKGETSVTTNERTVIERQVRHVVRLVDDLLDISKITRGLITLERTRLDLSSIVSAAVEMCSSLVQQRGHRMHVNAPVGLHVHGDEHRLVQVISNLLTNAARYTPNGGDITLSLAADGEDVVLEVSDSGVGLASELLPRIFEAFVQGARSTDRAEGGLGLGLAITKNLVTLHGGAIEARSPGSGGQGSTFSVRLPRSLHEAPAAAPVAELEAPLDQSRRVLVVDDNRDAADLLGELVRLQGHEVTVVHDPETAIVVGSTFRPEVAVLDIGLPGMDGYELAARLRLQVPDCRMIALTGFGQDADRARAADAGFSAHLVKPVKVKRLLELLSST